MSDITLKHICRDFELDPYKLRMALRRANFPKHKSRHWRWDSEQDPQYLAVRQFAQENKESLL